MKYFEIFNDFSANTITLTYTFHVKHYLLTYLLASRCYTSDAMYYVIVLSQRSSDVQLFMAHRHHVATCLLLVTGIFIYMQLTGNAHNVWLHQKTRL
jgi:hypothetical protein